MKATIGAYQKACPDLAMGAMGLIGTCPVCDEYSLTIKTYEDGGFDAICDNGCRRKDMDAAAVGTAGVNGHAPIEERATPPPPKPPSTKTNTTKEKRFKFLSFDEACAVESPGFQTEGFIIQQSFVQAFGETNHGKSLLTCDYALHLASEAEEWFGMKILQHGPIVWVNADGGLKFSERLQAWAEMNGRPTHDCHILYGSARINHPGEMILFREQLMEMDPKPVLVVFDTQSRCMPGSDENDQGTMTAVTENLHKLKTEVGCVVMLIHHTDKTGQWERGSGVIKNETDTQIRVTYDESSRIGTVNCRKARDADRFKDFHFSIKPVGSSVVVMQADGPAPVTPQEKRITKQFQMLTIICNEPGVSCETCSSRIDRSLRSVERYAEKMEKDGLIKRVEVGISERGGAPRMGLFPTEKGRSATEVSDIDDDPNLG